MRWVEKDVKRTIWETEVKQVKVVAAPKTRVDCCGNHVPIVLNSCSCAGGNAGGNASAPASASPKFTMRAVSRQVPRVITEKKRVEVPCKVKVAKQVPYDVWVNKEEVEWVNKVEDYFTWEYRTISKMVDVKKRIPIVTRKCTDATGKEVQDSAAVPLHHSGPAPEDVNRPAEPVNKAPVETAPVQQLPASAEKGPCNGKPCVKLTNFQRASLVRAPLDRNLGNGNGIVQVGVVDYNPGWAQPNMDYAAKKDDNSNSWTAKNMMAGQWNNSGAWETNPCSMEKTNC